MVLRQPRTRPVGLASALAKTAAIRDSAPAWSLRHSRWRRGRRPHRSRPSARHGQCGSRWPSRVHCRRAALRRPSARRLRRSRRRPRRDRAVVPIIASDSCVSSTSPSARATPEAHGAARKDLRTVRIACHHGSAAAVRIRYGRTGQKRSLDLHVMDIGRIDDAGLPQSFRTASATKRTWIIVPTSSGEAHVSPQCRARAVARCAPRFRRCA